MSKSKERREKRRVSARKRATEHKSGFESTSINLPKEKKFFSVSKEGVIRIDIIPYEVPEGAENPYADPGDLHFERTFWMHRGVGADQVSVVCPKKTAQKKCPICDYRAKISKEPDTDEDLVKDLAPKERQLWNVFDHDNPKEGVQVWDVSYHLFGKHLDARVKNADEEDGYEFFADPDEGMTLKIGMVEKSFGGNKFYSAEGGIDFKPRRAPLDEELVSEACVLDSLLLIKSYDELKKLFFQTGTEEEKTEKEEPRRQPRKKKIPTAEDAGIEKGDEVVYKKGLCSVVKISGDGTSLTLMDEEDEIVKAVGVDEVTLVEDDEKPEKEEPEEEEASEEGTDDGDDWDEDWDD